MSWACRMCCTNSSLPVNIGIVRIVSFSRTRPVLCTVCSQYITVTVSVHVCSLPVNIGIVRIVSFSRTRPVLCTTCSQYITVTVSVHVCSLPFAGDNFVRWSGDAHEMSKRQRMYNSFCICFLLYLLCWNMGGFTPYSKWLTRSHKSKKWWRSIVFNRCVLPCYVNFHQKTEVPVSRYITYTYEHTYIPMHAYIRVWIYNMQQSQAYFESETQNTVLHVYWVKCFSEFSLQCSYTHVVLCQINVQNVVLLLIQAEVLLLSRLKS